MRPVWNCLHLETKKSIERASLFQNWKEAELARLVSGITITNIFTLPTESVKLLFADDSVAPVTWSTEFYWKMNLLFRIWSAELLLADDWVAYNQISQAVIADDWVCSCQLFQIWIFNQFSILSQGNTQLSKFSSHLSSQLSNTRPWY
jgi:hypothetical protein